MARNPDLPRPTKKILTKPDLLNLLRQLDDNNVSRDRILLLETAFRKRIDNHVAALPENTSKFSEFNTSPFVLMFYCKQKQYKHVFQIEQDILPAKIFSSMETSAGRMVQSIVLPMYGWESVETTTMHSPGSVIDGRKIEENLLKLATIKSGPRCLNDEMSKDIASDIVEHAEQWAMEAGVDHIDFTYGVLYGTQVQSNKKDWHILRNIVEAVGTRFVIEQPRNRWICSFKIRNIRIDVSVRIGADLFTYIGDELTLMELLCSLIRACVIPAASLKKEPSYLISWDSTEKPIGMAFLHRKALLRHNLRLKDRFTFGPTRKNNRQSAQSGHHGAKAAVCSSCQRKGIFRP